MIVFCLASHWQLLFKLINSCVQNVALYLWDPLSSVNPNSNPAQNETPSSLCEHRLDLTLPGIRLFLMLNYQLW
eukprot:g14153.t1